MASTDLEEENIFAQLIQSKNDGDGVIILTRLPSDLMLGSIQIASLKEVAKHIDGYEICQRSQTRTYTNPHAPFHSN